MIVGEDSMIFGACAQTYFKSSTKAPQKLYGSFAEARQKFHRSFIEVPQNFQTIGAKCIPLKATIYRAVFLCRHEWFVGALMQRRFRRTCPLCGRLDLKHISTHLLQVHGLSSEERKPYLKQAQVSSWQPHVDKPPHMTMSFHPYMNNEKPREKRVSQCERSPPAKRPRTAARTTTSLATKPYPEFYFRHKYSLQVVGPTQSGKTYFAQQILEHNRIAYEERKNIRIFWY